MLNSAVWFITMNCQNHCPYCWERQRQTRGEFTPTPFIDYKKWVKAWNDVVKQNHGIGFVVDITGGEPFMQPGFINMLHELNNDINIAITTNLKGNMAEFVQKIDPSKVFSMTLSYHPTEMDLDIFLGKAILLKQHGFKITVNFVAWPEQMYLLPKVKKAVEGYAIDFHVDPYSVTPYMPYVFNDDEKRFLNQFVGLDRSIVEREKRNVLCSGGMSHMVVMPEGNVYRCVNDSINGSTPIGNILSDSGCVLNDKKTFCDNFHICAGCDRDKVKVENA